MTKPTILIAGGTGTNGRELLKQLTEKQISARALVRDLNRSASLASEFVELVQGDLSEPNSLPVAFEGIEKAYIVTSINQNTTQWFENFFVAAKKAGVSHLVKYSGYGSSEDSASEVIRQHGLSDRLLRESGLTYTILRPPSFFQNLLWQAEPIKTAGQFYLPLGDARQSMVDVRDVAEATVRILMQTGHENRAYDLTGAEAPNAYELAEKLSDVLGRDITYVPVTVEAAKASMLEGGMSEWDARVLAEIQGVFATGIYADVKPDLANILEREPRSFEVFVRDHIEAFGG